MNSIATYQDKINAFIANNPYSKFPVELYEPLDYIMSIGGKRMRPVIVMMGCDLFNGNIDESIHAAIAIETFHNFTLMHDDIMDNAPLRRGRLTVHEKWNTNTAILSGDVMLVEAYGLLMYYPDQLLRPILNIFNKTAIEVCEGQQIDMLFETMDTVGIDEYINMIALKTAVVLGASLQVGALIAGASAQQASLLYEFGKNMGIAFQLRDDYLDLYADASKFGKQIGGDVIANKKTYMLIKALELSNGKVKESLIYWLKTKEVQPEEKVAAIRQIFDDLQIPELINNESKRYAELAFGQFDLLTANEGNKEVLKNFMNDLLSREV